MLTVLGDVLPLAVGIAISPIPVIAVVLMLLSPNARGASIGFTIGWVIGIASATALFTVLASILPHSDPGRTAPIAGAITVVLGLLSIVLSLQQLRSRAAQDEDPQLPTWMSAVDSVTVGKSIGLGVLLAALNPKNLIMAVGAGITIGSTALDTGPRIATIAIFTAAAAVSVLVPVVAYLVRPQTMGTALDRLRGWLVINNATVMAVLMFVIGTVLLGKGAGMF